MTKLQAAFLVLQCTLCLTIRVPVIWNGNSGINNNGQLSPAKQPVQAALENIPKEYFEYSANKPQFAIDIAASHGVEAPAKHYSSYPVNPYTGFSKPSLGQHLLLDPQNEKFQPYQAFVSETQGHNYVKPTSTSFEIYHPYKAEEPALQEIYRDPVLNKIRDDLRDSKNRLQKYESEAGEPNIEKEEYLESPEETDRRLQPHKNIPAKYEKHRPLRHPIYYKPSMQNNYRENILNKKFKHPLYQNYAKIAPIHYHPIKNHLQRLRQQHTLKFDDEHNEYPQLLPPDPYAEKPDGYDIYEKGKDKFIKLRNNVDETINKVARESSPSKSQKLELQYEDDKNEPLSDQNDEFVPVKNYAQVRKTETTKHLPREKAFEDADSYDEIKNAPRLREAIKSTKAQIFYTEEGYEDSAYDHAGEQKHASDHEGHGGHLKENEHSKGKYKIPSISYSNDDAKGSAYRDQVLHGKKWQDNKKDTENASELEDYSDNEHDVSAESDSYSNISDHESTQVDEPENLSIIRSTPSSKIRNKRQDANENKKLNANIQTANKQTKNTFVPEIDLNSIINQKQLFSSSNIKKEDKFSKHNLILKYPYYFREITGVNKDSPLRYAENLSLIPKKSHGGTEFYDSRATIACSEVEEIDPIPEALKKGENPTSGDTKETANKRNNDKQRLKGLGDKIDCFKAKYFGENPLDSPFFNEDIISNPKPVIKPNLDIFDAKYPEKRSSNTKQHENLTIKNNQNKTINIFKDIDLLNGENQHTISNKTSLSTENSNILSSANISNQLFSNFQEKLHENLKDDITIDLLTRKKRATSFVYEPYKILKESQVQDSKKTTTTSNISPLIKQLQSSRIIDRGNIKHKEQPIKINTNSKVYQDIDKTQRRNPTSIETSDQSHLSIDKRRGEPRYDLQHPNHKTYYTPVENKAAMSLEDYVEKTNDQNIGIRTTLSHPVQRNLRKNTEISSGLHLPNDSPDVQNIAASNAIKNVLHATVAAPSSRKTDVQKHTNQDNEEEEEYDEYDSDTEHESDEEHKITIKTTTPKTLVSRRQHGSHKIATATVKSKEEEESDYNDNDYDKQSKNKPKLELITRFREPSHSDTKTDKNNKLFNKNNHSTHNKSTIPKYREKKKKMTKSTLVTDTKTYGEDDDDDMRKDEVDAMIGVQHDEDDYMPSYEKKTNNKESKHNKKKNIITLIIPERVGRGAIPNCNYSALFLQT